MGISMLLNCAPGVPAGVVQGDAGRGGGGGRHVADGVEAELDAAEMFCTWSSREL